jgi:fructose PTS system EIIBC or EIIC component
MTSGTLLPLADFLSVDRIAVPSSASTKDAALEQLVALAVPPGPNRDGLLVDVRRREAQFTTALGDGIALPHARSPFVHAVQVSAIRFKEPVAFDAVDGRPVWLAFLVASPDNNPGAHLEVLRDLSLLLEQRAVVEAMRAADTADALYDAIRRAPSA